MAQGLSHPAGKPNGGIRSSGADVYGDLLAMGLVPVEDGKLAKPDSLQKAIISVAESVRGDYEKAMRDLGLNN